LPVPLAGAAVAESDHVLPPLEVLAARQLQHPQLVQRRDRGDVEIQLCWPALDPAQHQMLEGIEADRPQPERLVHGALDVLEPEALKQPHNRDVFPLAGPAMRASRRRRSVPNASGNSRPCSGVAIAGLIGGWWPRLQGGKIAHQPLTDGLAMAAHPMIQPLQTALSEMH
jgi:hypothetical protein